MASPRAYTDMTIKRLFGLSGNQCSFPGCEKVLVDQNNAVNSNICHIEAANPDGERYNPNMTDPERADYTNLILLCPSHHKETDDVKMYTVDVLKHMKAAHENAVRALTAAKGILNKRPTLLAFIVNRISAIEVDDVIDTDVVNSFSVEDKIEYNQVCSYAPVIKEYRVYQGKLNSLYMELERTGSGRKSTLLRNIRRLYLKAKGLLLGGDSSHEKLQENADKLIEYVETSLYRQVEVSPNTVEGLVYEELTFALDIIIVDAFMRCKILEEPK